MKLSFSKLGHYGRFGNSLFQISALMGFKEKYNAEISFPEWDYEQYFINPLPHGEIFQNVIKETNFNFYDWQLKETEDYDILGYLQSEKYFLHINKIKEQFTFKPELIETVKAKLPDNGKEKILLQLRRTDYVCCAAYYQLPITYYIDALITHFPNWRDCQIIVISDDIPYCKVHFECLPNVHFADVPDYEQIITATLCDHFIIANSSFGWWGSWLGEKPHSKIVHPGRLHSGKLLEQTNEQDYWPERWINFKKDSYRIELTDCTFTIPVYFDHPDRKQNLDLSVCILQRDFDTNIIIGEQGGKRFEYMSKFCNYMKFDLKHFHRTKMLNDMAMAAETPYIANWDCDVIIPPFQLYLTLEELRRGSHSVFPYDGRFARMPRVPWFRTIEKHYDIGMVRDANLKGKYGKPLPVTSVGGAIFFNKESFIEGGLENEHMISFGPEDSERNDRFNLLGFKIDRVGGCLYHIDHFCGPDSSTRNPYFRANNIEYEKIHAMSKEELRLYVDTFPWRHKYTEQYYKRISEGAIKSAEQVYRILDIDYQNMKIIDVGCGVGEWSCGNQNYMGVDWKIPKRNLIISPEQYINCDLEKNVVIGKYDLCLCLEVAEHLSEARADVLVEMLCRLSDKVLFSAAIPHQGGTGHINEQWQTWWAEKFYHNGFVPSLKQPDIRDSKEIEIWYRQNLIVYEKNSGEYTTVVDYVHPEYYEQIVKYLKKNLAIV